MGEDFEHYGPRNSARRGRVRIVITLGAVALMVLLLAVAQDRPWVLSGSAERQSSLSCNDVDRLRETRPCLSGPERPETRGGAEIREMIEQGAPSRRPLAQGVPAAGQRSQLLAPAELKPGPASTAGAPLVSTALPAPPLAAQSGSVKRSQFAVASREAAPPDRPVLESAQVGRLEGPLEQPADWPHAAERAEAGAILAERPNGPESQRADEATTGAKSPAAAAEEAQRPGNAAQRIVQPPAIGVPEADSGGHEREGNGEAVAVLGRTTGQQGAAAEAGAARASPERFMGPSPAGPDAPVAAAHGSAGETTPEPGYSQPEAVRTESVDVRAVVESLTAMIPLTADLIGLPQPGLPETHAQAEAGRAPMQVAQAVIGGHPMVRVDAARPKPGGNGDQSLAGQASAPGSAQPVARSEAVSSKAKPAQAVGNRAAKRGAGRETAARAPKTREYVRSKDAPRHGLSTRSGGARRLHPVQAMGSCGRAKDGDGGMQRDCRMPRGSRRNPVSEGMEPAGSGEQAPTQAEAVVIVPNSGGLLTEPRPW